jgi:hypothetical protein
MNIAGGARRMRRVGRYVVLAALGVFALLFGLLAAALLRPSLGIHFAMIDLILLPILVAIPGASLWLAGWIVEGFAEKDQPGQLRT